ncbi:hypothetical protein [Mesorhizobium sp. 131-3-5]|uniref:hypothetical protein n=1 Tax=Mesorhizobium sp. 131-3-5 TaxID=2744520 RepID=UPI001929253C|nr:hypothetical protein [Mesorhizobium sp. 131-3-5]
MYTKAEVPSPSAELAREELLRFLSTGFAGSCLGESNEMLTYLETTASSDKPGAPALSGQGRNCTFAASFQPGDCFQLDFLP